MQMQFRASDGLTRVWSPTWSEDGRTLYFLWNRGESMDLWQQDLGDDGALMGEPQPITVGIGMRHAVFSSDGSKLAYFQRSRGQESLASADSRRPCGNMG